MIGNVLELSTQVLNGSWQRVHGTTGVRVRVLLGNRMAAAVGPALLLA